MPETSTRISSRGQVMATAVTAALCAGPLRPTIVGGAGMDWGGRQDLSI